MKQERQPLHWPKALLSLLMALALAFSMAGPVWAGETPQKNTSATAIPIKVNEKASGVLTNMFDEHWYTVTVPQAGVTQLVFENQQSESSKSWSVNFYQQVNGGAGTRLLSYSFGADRYLHYGSKMGLPAGQYLIKVNAYSAYQLQYYISLSFTPSGDWEIEPNNDTYQATPIKTNKTVYGSSISMWDNDWYSFKLNKRQTVRLEFANDTSDMSWFVSIYRDIHGGAGNRMQYYTVSGNRRRTNLPAVTLPAGRYFVKVSASYNTGGQNYNFKVASRKPLRSFRLNRSNATLRVGRSMSLRGTKFSPAKALRTEAKWSSNRPSVVYVDNQGRITALRRGTATISCTISGVTRKCKVRVVRW